LIFIWQKKCQHDYSGNEPTIIPSEKYQVPHYFFKKKKISFFLRNKELLDFFLGKGNAFFNRSIIELIVVAQKKKINNDTT
jgi:hypothetical protein